MHLSDIYINEYVESRHKDFLFQYYAALVYLTIALRHIKDSN